MSSENGVWIYYVGSDLSDAQRESLPYQDPDSALEYARDNGGLRVFGVWADPDWSTVEEVEP